MEKFGDIYEVMVGISIGVLTFIFVCAFVGLLFVCRRQRKRQSSWNRLDNNIRSSKHKKCTEPELALALNDIGLGSALEQILGDKQWVDDASDVIPHCLAVLRTCHSLTERLADLAMRPLSLKTSTGRLIEAIKRVSYRVDDVVASMYPPLDARLLEARLAALVLAVGQVALLTQSVSLSPENEYFDWIADELSEMDNHLLALRKAAQQIDNQNRIMHHNNSQV